jgi:hypothetical protein
MANEVTIDPRYMTYDKDEVQALLDKVNNADAEPTAESGNMISSGAVHEALGNYNTKEEIEEKLTQASEEAVRGIVKNYTPDADPEPEPEEA